MSYSSIHRIDNVDTPDQLHDIVGTAVAKVIRLRCYSWGAESGACDWRRRGDIIANTTADLLDIVVVTDIYSNFARRYLAHRFNNGRYDLYTGRNNVHLALVNCFLFLVLCALIYMDPTAATRNWLGLSSNTTTDNYANYTGSESSPVAELAASEIETNQLIMGIAWWLYFATVVFLNVFILHIVGTGGGILLIVKKTLQAFPLEYPTLVKHGFLSKTGYMTFMPVGTHLLTIVGGLASGQTGSSQLARAMMTARTGTFLVGDFGRPIAAFQAPERAPFITIVDSGTLAILAQNAGGHASTIPSSTGRTRNIDNYLLSVFATLKLLNAGDPDEEVVIVGSPTPPQVTAAVRVAPSQTSPI